MDLSLLRYTTLLILPILSGTIHLEGEIEVTKPPQRQEFLWQKSAYDQVRWPTVPEEKETSQVESRFRKGERPTVASYPYWIAPSVAPPSDTSSQVAEYPPSRKYPHIQTSRPPTAAPLSPGHMSNTYGQPGRPPTVAPLPPHMKPDPYDFPARPNVPTPKSPQPILHSFDESQKHPTVSPESLVTRLNPHNHQGYPPEAHKTTRKPQSIKGYSSANDPKSVEPLEGISHAHYSGRKIISDSAVPPTECTGRGHSWGCGPFRRESVAETRDDETEGHDVKDSSQGRRREMVLEHYKDDNAYELLRRDTGSPMRITGGWSAMQDWCLLPTGQFPYPLDCRRFVNCWNGIGYVQPCAPGTLFNSETFECDFPSKVKGCKFSNGDVGKSLDVDAGAPPNSNGQWQHQHRPGNDLISAASGSLVNCNGDDCDDYGEREIDIRHGELTDMEDVEPDVSPHRHGNHASQIVSTPSTVTTPSTTSTPTIAVASSIESRGSGASGNAKLMKGYQTKMLCPQQNGIFPHPEFCDRFINCHQGRPHSMMCGPGTNFDPISRQCDHAHRVKCLLPAEVLEPEESRHITISLDPGSRKQPRNNSKDIHGPTDTEQPRTISERPRTTSERPRTISERPRTISERPRTISERPRAISERPRTISERPRTISERQPGQNEKTEAPVPTTFQHLPPWIEEEIESKEQPLTPSTGQTVRLRGGSWPWEGFVEIYKSGEWRPVCDEVGKWNLNEGSVVCRQLGYHRGADITWQGNWSKNSRLVNVHVGKVECQGKESSIVSCQLGPLGTTAKCNLVRDAAGVRCIKEYRSLCGLNEIPYGGHCYSAVVGSDGQQLISRETASKECEKRGALLASITSQEENDFLSEWLVLKHPKVYLVMTGGVGMPITQSQNVWMWEASQMAMSFTNWWNGWKTNAEQVTLETGTYCMAMSRKFPCTSEYKNVSEESTKIGRQRIETSTTISISSSPKPQWCTTDYHFWFPQDCNMLTHGAICKRNPNDIGCVWNLGMDYMGKANVTRHGSPCRPWDEGPFGYPHPDNQLQGHNLCRNHGGADGGGAAEGHPWCYIDSSGAWESCEIPPCRYKDAERSASGVDVTKQCGNNEYHCSDEECIPSTLVCDGLPDCSNGKDEMDCQGLLKEFRHKGGMKLDINKKSGEKLSHMVEKWVQISAEDCANHCLKKESIPFQCNSFSYHLKDKQCLLVGNSTGELSSFAPGLVKALGWDHYELLPSTINCRGMFHCKNGSCVNSNKVCNGINDCGDRSDEVNCSLDAVNFSLRLVGGNVSHEGRIEVKAFGHWGVVCDDLFGLADADKVCREAGFSLGAAEVVSHSGFGSGVIKGSPLFLMDDLECIGTEKSLSQCKFPGWGDHNCGQEEVAGVVCKIPGAVCQDDQFHCQSSKECIPLEYLCDNLKDCEDGSDEESARCQSEVLIRLVEGPTNLEGRVEVRYNGIWGTVCDDDFGVSDAQVICRNLGLGWGPSVLALKGAHYGSGKGPIWLDELHCSGEEEKIVDCPRFPWGKNNCGHKEDASVKCTAPGDTGITSRKSSTPQFSVSKAGENAVKPHAGAEDILPSGCGINSNISTWLNAFGVQKNTHAIQPKVTGGEEFKLGPIPWQASLRVRSAPGKSVHWCGAVVLSPLLALTAGHCIQDYSKEAYILRVGDFDAKINEGTEQEVTIEEVYLHDEFNKGPYLNNDIAVLKLKVPGIRFSEHVHAACLPTQEDVTLEGQWNPASGECIISGWGSVGSGAGFSRTLRSAVLPLLSHTVCKAAHVYGEKAIGKGMGCAGSLKEGGSDSCQGDSGGPLICFEKGNEPILYGITSWGQGCGRANKPGVYSRVAFYRSWINQKVQEAMSGM